jgi:hypothetical protein
LKKITKEEAEKVIKENNNFIVFDSSKYKNLVEAIISGDYFSKRIVTMECDVPTLMEMNDYADNTEDLIKFLSKEMKITYNYFGIDMLHLTQNLPTNVSENFDSYYDSSCLPEELMRMLLVYMASLNGLKINIDKDIIDFSNENEMNGYTVEKFQKVFSEFLYKEYKVNKLDLSCYFENLITNEEDFKNKIKSLNMARKIKFC